MTKDKTCKERVASAFENRMGDIRALHAANDEEVENIGRLSEYGLSIDYVEAGTFRDQRAGYTRYQLSWGGPSEEFRIFDNGEVEFWFLDWFDGAPIEVTGRDADIIKDICYGVKPEHVNWDK